MATGVSVRGLRELQVAFAAAGKQANKELRASLREVAEPVRSDAEQFAVSGIPRVGVAWSRMRVGVTRRSIYVAPKARGVKGRGSGGRRRPKFGTLLMDRALEPALERNAAQIEGRVERLLDNVAGGFNRTG